MLAPAKINLSLYVLGKRSDGYHELESLVTFADIGDQINSEITVESYKLSVTGEKIEGDIQDNLILKAANLFKSLYPNAPYLHFHLNKFLPVASGMGGGSSDAAATLRILSHLCGGVEIMSLATQLGADVPVCLYPATKMMRGIGHDLSDSIHFPPLHALLVNPRRSVSTATVFKNMRSYTENPPEFNLIAAKNDMETAAIEAEPLIGEVLTELRSLEKVQAARMTGSGATCFALFDDEIALETAFLNYANKHSGYWIKKARLGLEFNEFSPI